MHLATLDLDVEFKRRFRLELRPKARTPKSFERSLDENTAILENLIANYEFEEY